jgi:hypothetical protein
MVKDRFGSFLRFSLSASSAKLVQRSWSAYSGIAAIPEAYRFRGTDRRRHIVWSFRLSLMDLPYPRERGFACAADDVGLSPVELSAVLPGETIKHLEAARRVTVLLDEQTRRGEFSASAQSGAWRHPSAET